MKRSIIHTLFMLASLALVTSCVQSTEGSGDVERDSDSTNTSNTDWQKDLESWAGDALNSGKELVEEVGDEIKSIEINSFSVEEDKQLGKQLYDEIHNSPDYKVLDRKRYKALYAYVESIKQTILQNGGLRYGNTFDWDITILNDDQTINAFCAPGGYIFIYTGILKYLENEAEFAGVLAHEMGHADRRHGTRQMTKSMGIQMLLDVLTDGENSRYYGEVIAGLVSLRYSRSYEREADECSVRYLCSTDYTADGGAGFFRKILKEQGEASVELLSTHPDPGERVSNFKESKKEMNCSGKEKYTDRYRAVVAKSLK
jgi:predicted Zn-dependent protease